MGKPSHGRSPPKPRWTHIALRVTDIDETIDWYTSFTPLELLARRQDEDGFGAWLAMSDTADSPFVLVVAQFLPDKDPFSPTPNTVLGPFAHLGIEMTSKEEVDEMAALAETANCLAMPATQMPAPIGYICMLSDPDGNTVEFSWDQGVYATAQAKWGVTAEARRETLEQI